MEKWQENRNYRRIKDQNGNIVANIITVDGMDVPVTEEVYAAYQSSVDWKYRAVAASASIDEAPKE